LGIAHIIDKSFPHEHIRTALGAFYNHSETPNCIVLNGFWHQINVKYLVTHADIKSGDELTATYTLYDVSDA
jgi:SET domain-containing protein